MLSELRTSQLSPQKYYELYMMIFDQLADVEAFFGDERSKGRTYAELYEMVQHAGNVLPRLYLMVAVGCLYIKSGEAPARDILKDLVELCKGVGTARDREKREIERQQLADLVGRNLTYISQLDGLGFDMYSQQVLPRVMEQIISCKDDIAQQYLFQAVVQCFPDVFHLDTLSSLLNALPELQPGVKVHTVLAGLMDRLARYAATDAASLSRLTSMHAFDRFKDAISHILMAQNTMPAADAVEMYAALMNFTGSVHPQEVDKVNKALLLNATPCCHAGSAVQVVFPSADFSLPQQALLLDAPHAALHIVAETVLFIQPLVYDAPPQAGAGTHPGAMLTIDDLDDEDVQNEQTLVARALHSLHAPDPDVQLQLLQVAQQQLFLGGMRRLRHTLPALGFATLRLVRRVTGGEAAKSVTAEALLQWLLQQCTTLAEVPEPLMALRLLLAGALAASEEAQGLEMLAYSFFEQASANVCGYASRLLRRGDQCRAVCMASRLSWQEDAKPDPSGSVKGHPPVRDAKRVMACLQRALKIANAAKQQAVASSSPFKLASLAGAAPAPAPLLGAATPASQQHPLGLFVEVLNHYLLYLDAGLEEFTPSAVQLLIDKVQEEVESDVAAARLLQQQQQQQQASGGEQGAGGSSMLGALTEALRYWLSTARHIEFQKASADGKIKERYSQLQIKPQPDMKHLLA
ncbi:vacuolar protein sorting-associated protein 35-domain-containing protein [Dunaliella salina]|uniref:Vacuolar protein sorting-associated protein 35-domain-containing protein n=1 Tax=Dunaliella salina TaxID=3046 RepID=A0ABQ7HAC2_DUNSA|nr:vacuolar protein sorting-associated protein 35-domain-containing protein [Dunaliella salina]|eukprot:KAF5843796.1 vacuolar protein sorting-associated protein 35-domain-containing protein [Dunaliella salina]